MVMMLVEEGETGLVKQQSCSSIKLMSKQLFFARQKIFRNIPPTPYQKLLGKLRRVIELHPPPDAEILGALNFIAKQDDIQLPHQLAQTMAQKSKNCLQQAIRSFEATLRSGYPFKEDQLIVTGWEDEFASIAQSIIEEQSPGTLFLVRGKLINLIELNPCPQFIFSGVVGELMKTVDNRSKLDIESLCQEFGESPKLIGNYYEERNIISFQDKSDFSFF
ncbi:hypothetical protein SLE2022_091300 [Rubroshorea leprosula]